jgi:hypothetical protein
MLREPVTVLEAANIAEKAPSTIRWWDANDSADPEATVTTVFATQDIA